MNKYNKYNFSKGFTLVELLVVIAILGILAAGLLVAINPIERINAANDTKVINDLGSVARSLEAYAANNNGSYPPEGATFNASLAPVVTEGGMKVVPTAPNNYESYVYTPSPASCGLGSCTSFVLWGEVKSIRNRTPVGSTTPIAPVSGLNGGVHYKVESATAKSCPLASNTGAGSVCP